MWKRTEKWQKYAVIIHTNKIQTNFKMLDKNIIILHTWGFKTFEKAPSVI